MPVIVTIATPGPGEKLCEVCKGRGASSAYDDGVRSLAHDRELAAPVECSRCGGTGLVEDAA